MPWIAALSDIAYVQLISQMQVVDRRTALVFEDDRINAVTTLNTTKDYGLVGTFISEVIAPFVNQ